MTSDFVDHYYVEAIFDILNTFRGKRDPNIVDRGY